MTRPSRSRPEASERTAARDVPIRERGVIPAKYKLLMAMAAASADGVGAFADEARAAGASDAEIAEALHVRRTLGRPRAPRGRRPTRLGGVRAAAAACCALLIAIVAIVESAPPGTADPCADVAPAPAAGCGGPTQDGPPRPPWLGAIEQRDPQFVESYLPMRQRILSDGAIPSKYKLLIGMVTDAIAAHPDGVKGLADNARGAGASEAEITEAVEVGYLFGGTAALVMGVNAFKG
ncbi:carboxymuconolactone decarboxylase family protein [Mycobacterium saskatchewanense]|uniref:carboxymuconolactone decarboxylase family protein n=1 Tax=Mycobacterium saskatchewanense TaxID=220927 RepID=UPI000A148E4B|nr:carboxymuconolactone decarboxylase family protein [Mycobacterium saskatchewanense]